MHDDDIERILVVMAHPDDVEFGAAGSVAHWTDMGIEVAYRVPTSRICSAWNRLLPRRSSA
jgi:LmbE family N-acetylglucosaminyl deacetylase